nr:MAG TPA: hypothetical protein [Caudoviricetes sp.]
MNIQGVLGEILRIILIFLKPNFYILSIVLLHSPGTGAALS